MILDGAAEPNLPLFYQASLARIQPYTITTTRQRIGKAIIDGVWGSAIRRILSLWETKAGSYGYSPPWLMKLTNISFSTMWASYDYTMFYWIFGDRERTMRT